MGIIEWSQKVITIPLFGLYRNSEIYHSILRRARANTLKKEMNVRAKAIRVYYDQS